jgi:hypothetical protein
MNGKVFKILNFYKFSIFLFSFNLLASDKLSALLLNGNCITCHNAQGKSAPPMIKVKQVYKKHFPNKQDFVINMSNWIKHPKIKTSLMPNEIKKYGLMPEIAFDEDTLLQITQYLYEF